LYADPHLAKEAAQTIEPKDSAARPMSGAGKDAASKKGKARTSSRVPNGDIHEQRIPVFQWAILLLLFGAAAYQLRKVFLLPEKHGKRRKSKGAVTTASIARDWTKIPSELLEANMNSAVDLNRKKGIPQAKTKKKRKVTMPMLETTSSSKNSSKLVPSIPSDRQMEPAAALEKANGAVWQTDSEVKRLPVSTGKSETFEELPTLIDQLPPPQLEPPLANVINKGLGKKKKKPKITQSKSQTESIATPRPPATPTAEIDYDEELAKELQLEENMAAAAGDNQKGEVGWEEVPARHGKRENEPNK
jgi:hypothetical protein